MSRILICGSRNWSNRRAIRAALINCDPMTDTIVHGGAPGADRMAGEEAYKLGFQVEVHYAQWDLHGKSAGPIRNKKMLDSGLDKVYAFPLGRSPGTRHMIRIAEAADVEVEVYGEESTQSW